MAPAATANTEVHCALVDGIPCKKPAPKPPTTAYDSMITIRAIEDNLLGQPLSKNFLIYRGLLCFYSDFFNHTLNGPFKEGGSPVYVTNCKIKVFETFFYWMNTGVVSTGQEGGELQYEKDAVDLYAFADSIDIFALKNHALELYFDLAYANEKVDIAAVKSIYEQTPENSPMRRLAVDVLTATWNFRRFKKHCVGEIDLTLDLMQACITKKVIPGSGNYGGKRTAREWKGDMQKHFCKRYHEHNEIMEKGGCTG